MENRDVRIARLYGMPVLMFVCSHRIEASKLRSSFFLFCLMVRVPMLSHQKLQGDGCSVARQGNVPVPAIDAKQKLQCRHSCGWLRPGSGSTLVGKQKLLSRHICGSQRTGKVIALLVKLKRRVYVCAVRGCELDNNNYLY